MRRSGVLVITTAMAALLAGCSQPADQARAQNPQKYDRDRSDCAAQVKDYMKTRRNVDNSRRDVFQGQYDRYGDGALPAQMDAYSDTKADDRAMARCMEAKGWPQPDNRPWWERIGR